MTLNFAQTSVVKSRPSVLHGANLFIIILSHTDAENQLICCCSSRRLCIFSTEDHIVIHNLYEAKTFGEKVYRELPTNNWKVASLIYRVRQ